MYSIINSTVRFLLQTSLSLKVPCLVLGTGFHSGTFFTIASTACPAAIRVSQFVLRKYINTLKNYKIKVIYQESVVY